MAKRKRKVERHTIDPEKPIVCFGRHYRNLKAFAWNFGMKERWAAVKLMEMSPENAVDAFERRHDNRKKTFKHPLPTAIPASWDAWLKAGVDLNDPHPRIGKHESHKK